MMRDSLFLAALAASAILAATVSARAAQAAMRWAIGAIIVGVDTWR